MMCYDVYFVNFCPNKHAQRFGIVSVLMQASMKTELYKLIDFNVTLDGVFF
jgi:hypothetical protein